MNWLNAILMYLPHVLEGVIAVEKVMKGAPGAAKKQIIMDAISAGAQAAKDIPESHVQAVSTLVDAVVGTLNSTKQWPLN